MPRKLVVGEEANGRPDVGKLWCGFDRRGYIREDTTLQSIERLYIVVL